MKSGVPIVAILIASTWWPAAAGSDQSDTGKELTKLFFVFSEGTAEHLERIGNLQKLAGRWEGQLRLTGIVRTIDNGIPTDLATLRGIDRIIAAAAARTDPEVPVALIETLRNPSHFFIFSDDMPGPVVVSDRGVLLDAVTGLMSDVHSTDIQENTWGKIKVFFN